MYRRFPRLRFHLSDVYAQALLASRLAEIERLTAIIEDGGHTYPTGTGIVRARPEVGKRSEAMRHAQSFLSEYGLTPAARSKVSATIQKTKIGFQCCSAPESGSLIAVMSRALGLLSAGVVVLSEVRQCCFMMASGADRLECHSRGWCGCATSTALREIDLPPSRRTPNPPCPQAGRLFVR